MGSVLKRHMQLLEMEQSRERPLSSWRHWSIMPTGKDESCDYAAWRTEGLEEMSSRCTNIWKLRCKENRLFPVVSTDRARANTHRLKHSRFLLDIRKHNFMVTVSMHGNRFPCVVMESTSVELLTSCLDMVLINSLQVSLLQQRGLRRWPPEGPTTTTQWSCENAPFVEDKYWGKLNKCTNRKISLLYNKQRYYM